ncbi:nucleoside-diphosphate sugar epimerase/dehydratase [Streptococcus sp. Marseille-Q3533]|uniref:polysaccharide biosynthesis protein n=1 Tax=Streptococcus TaxID=1301 RepID=UPI002023F0B9|nr:nucleoside-diphosphate sugar epimerase/dehydratase [Streptococcus sp. Marseille-Q3533]
MNKKMTDYVIDLVEVLNKQQKQVFWGFFDIASMVLSIIVSYILFYGLINPAPVDYVIYTGLTFLFYQLMIGFWGLNASISRYSKITDFMKIFFGVTISSILSYIICYAFLPLFSIRFIVLFILLTTFLILLPRITWQLIYSRRKKGNGAGEHRRTFLIGAGDGGALFMDSYQHPTSDLELVGILDDDEKKKGQKLGKIPVLGSYNELPELAKRYRVEKVIVAIPSLDPSEYERILQMCNQLNIKCFKMPKVESVVQGLHPSVSSFQKLDLADLLGRQEIRLDESRIGDEIHGKTILVTGAGGSIGSEICRQVSRFSPERVVLLGHGENSIYLIYHELIRKFQGIDFVPVIADIQDYDRLLQVFEQYEPAIVYHAAAHKHVPMMERNPKEAFKNNILGTYNVARAVDAARVPKMVMISTDKAVNPPNVMGATKRVAELIVTGFNQRSQSTYCAVRFGNVLGSRGSVIPVFERQIAEGGPVTVTDFRMTRYFMTIPEASRLVIHAGAYAKDGEVFILDMGKPVRIYDLAKKMVLLSGHTENEIPIVEVGIRPGEKLYEELLVSTELVENQVMDKIFVGKVNVMPLDRINQKIEEFRALRGAELKRAIISFANETTHVD